LADPLRVRTATGLARARRTRATAAAALGLIHVDVLLRSAKEQFAEAQRRRETLARITDAEIPDRQMESLRRIWSDAVNDIPYYASLVADGRAPGTITAWDELRDIPVLDRPILQQHPELFVRKSAAPDGYTRTAGSTGDPIRIGMNQAERDLMRVVKLSAWQDLGYTYGARLFLIWGHSHLLGTGWRGRLNHLKRRAADAMLGYRRVDAYRLNPETCARYAEELLQFRPIGVIGYGAALDLFARYAGAYRDRLRGLGVRFVLSTAEAPPRPDTIARVEDLFNCPGVEVFGGADFGLVAFRRDRAGFDVYHDLNYVEALPNEIDEGAAAALVTSLYPRYLPLIRYRVGDALTEPHRLPNGHVRTFAAVAGRVNDVIFLDGRDAIHSVAIFHCIHQEPSVHAIQMVLDDQGIEVLLVADAGDRAAMEARIRARMTQVHPRLADARFTYVTDLQTNLAGKRRWFVDRRTPCAQSQAS
jgi:phenylacetate-coenzyme A ligase PaaK-like adenylate-forming protein